MNPDFPKNCLYQCNDEISPGNASALFPEGNNLRENSPEPADPPAVTVGENTCPDHKIGQRSRLSETASFWQKEFILGDFRNSDFLGMPEIRGIREKRYNEEISGSEMSPDWIFYVVEKNPG
jgi:hypothetical protein